MYLLEKLTRRLIHVDSVFWNELIHIGHTDFWKSKRVRFFSLVPSTLVFSES